MQISVLTQIDIFSSIEEFDDLLIEINDYIEENKTPFVSSLEEILDDLNANVHNLSQYTVKSTMNFNYAGEFFKDIEEDIEEMDDERYPLLLSFLATIANSI